MIEVCYCSSENLQRSQSARCQYNVPLILSLAHVELLLSFFIDQQNLSSLILKLKLLPHCLLLIFRNLNSLQHFHFPIEQSLTLVIKRRQIFFPLTFDKFIIGKLELGDIKFQLPVLTDGLFIEQTGQKLSRQVWILFFIDIIQVILRLHSIVLQFSCKLLVFCTTCVQHMRRWHSQWILLRF